MKIKTLYGLITGICLTTAVTGITISSYEMIKNGEETKKSIQYGALGLTGTLLGLMSGYKTLEEFYKDKEKENKLEKKSKI